MHSYIRPFMYIRACLAAAISFETLQTNKWRNMLLVPCRVT